MGTRSLTVFEDDNGKYIATIYRQYDGYPSGHGKKLYDILNGMVVVNGLSSATPKKAANGIGCMAAQVVAGLKECIGNVYLESSPRSFQDLLQTMEDRWADYTYLISVHAGKPRVHLYAGHDLEFEGTFEDMGARYGFCEATATEELVDA